MCSVSWSPDGLLAIVSLDCTVRVCDVLSDGWLVGDSRIGSVEEIPAPVKMISIYNSRLCGGCERNNVHIFRLIKSSDKMGYLTKRGVGLIPSWKRRWIVVEDDTLRYYVHSDRLTMKGSISLDGCSLVTEDTLKDPCSIHLQTPDRLYRMKADDARDAALWRTYFTKVLK